MKRWRSAIGPGAISVRFLTMEKDWTGCRMDDFCGTTSEERADESAPTMGAHDDDMGSPLPGLGENLLRR